MPSFAVEVRFTPLIGLAAVLFGGLNTVLGLWTLALGAFNASLLLGPVLLVVGVVYLRRTYFRLEQGVAGGRTILSGPGRSGPLADGVTATSKQRFAVEEGQLVHVTADGTRTPAPVRRWMANRTDWRALEAALSEAARPGRPRTPDGGAS